MAPYRRSAVVTRQQRKLRDAYAARERGEPLHVAAKLAGMSVSGFWYSFLTKDNDDRFTRTDLTQEEEETIAAVLTRHANNGRYQRMTDLMDAVEMMVKTFPPERREKLRFINGRPGRKFCKAFQRRHSDKISFRKPSKQEAKRYLATSAEVLTDHLAKVERLVREHNIDPKRMINLDESGVSAERDDAKTTNGKVYCTRATVPETVRAAFSNVNRISLLACVHANGDVGRPMFVLQGTRLRYRMFQKTCDPTRVYEETIADCLPRGALVATRREVAGVDKHNFISWTKALVEDVKDLTSNGRKVLLLYDGYRSHMCIEALELFYQSGIIAYALPAHTSGTTQPLDRSLFGPWKARYRDIIDTVLAGRKRNDPPLNEFDVCQLITRAYTYAFTPENVMSGFRAAGLCPLDATKLLGKPRILNATEPDTVLDVDTMMKMLEGKRKVRSKELLEDRIVLKNGFIDTSKGVVLTSEKAMELLRDEIAVRYAKDALKRDKEEDKRLREQEEYAEKKAQRTKDVVAAMNRRHKLYGDALVLPRSLAKRREVARKRTSTNMTVVGLLSLNQQGNKSSTAPMSHRAVVDVDHIDESCDQWELEEIVEEPTASDDGMIGMNMEYGML